MSVSSLEITVSVDAMGGDNAPAVPVQGAVLACTRIPLLHVILFGDMEQIEPLLAEVPENIRQKISIEHCTEVVSGSDKPSAMIRKGQKSSMNRAIQVVNSGDCVGVVSAGNTGALMALALFNLRCLTGIERPALGRAIPTATGTTCILDLGANLQCSAEHLVQYGMMGAAFAETVIQVKDPIVGLLNIGTEEIKGPANIRHADSLLQKSHLNYQGFIEGSDLVNGRADVIVCDGFSGNVALKVAEGVFGLLRNSLKDAFHSTASSKLGGVLAQGAIKKSFARFDPIKLEGAALLGLKKTVVKAHGNTTAEGFSNAIKIALEMGNNHLEANIARHLELMKDIPADLYHPPPS